MSGEEKDWNYGDERNFLKDLSSDETESDDEDFEENVDEQMFDNDPYDEPIPYDDELTGNLSFSDIREEEDDLHLNEQIGGEDNGCTHTPAVICDDL